LYPGHFGTVNKVKQSSDYKLITLSMASLTATINLRLLIFFKVSTPSVAIEAPAPQHRNSERDLAPNSSPSNTASYVTRPRMADVAALAGVGLKTVSRVINGEPNVSEATREKVQRAVRQLGYHQDLYAGNLRRSGKRTHTLGLVLASVSNPFSSVLHRGVEHEAASRDTAVFAASVDDDEHRERQLFDAFIRRRVDGLIMTTASGDQSYVAKEQERGLPVVFVDRIPTNITADTIASDNFEASCEGVLHLIQHGHRDIAYFGDNIRIQTAAARLDGYKHALLTAGIPLRQELIFSETQSPESTFARAVELLRGPTPPTAIFSAQNLITAAVVRALKHLGLNHSIAVVGFDDFQLADVLDPPVTVNAQDPERIGALAAQKVFARLDGDTSLAQTTIVAARLIPRGSGEIPVPFGA
jgi:LacI family transcriptional regulator